jgi:hypothetical protein
MATGSHFVSIRRPAIRYRRMHIPLDVNIILGGYPPTQEFSRANMETQVRIEFTANGITLEDDEAVQKCNFQYVPTCTHFYRRAALPTIRTHTRCPDEQMVCILHKQLRGHQRYYHSSSSRNLERGSLYIDLLKVLCAQFILGRAKKMKRKKARSGLWCKKLWWTHPHLIRTTLMICMKSHVCRFSYA